MIDRFAIYQKDEHHVVLLDRHTGRAILLNLTDINELTGLLDQAAKKLRRTPIDAVLPKLDRTRIAPFFSNLLKKED